MLKYVIYIYNFKHEWLSNSCQYIILYLFFFYKLQNIIVLKKHIKNI